MHLLTVKALQSVAAADVVAASGLAWTTDVTKPRATRNSVTKAILLFQVGSVTEGSWLDDDLNATKTTSFITF